MQHRIMPAQRLYSPTRNKHPQIGHTGYLAGGGVKERGVLLAQTARRERGGLVGVAVGLRDSGVVEQLQSQFAQQSSG
jgi:hypothetical protein